MLRIKKNWTGYALIFPAIIAIFFLSVFPLLNGILLSFKNYNLVRPWDPEFNAITGLSNYIKIFSDKNFILSLKNTLIWTVANLFFQLIFSMLLALALNRKMAGRSVFRTLALVPWAVPAAVAAMTFTFLFNANLGIINILFVKMGIVKNSVSWLGNIGSAMACVSFVAIWKGIPFQMIFILAALQGISGDIYESAKIDGSNGWSTFWRITIPIIKQPLAIATILNSIGILTSFNIIWIMTEGGPLFSTEILYTFAYREAFINHNFGTAASASVVLFLVLAVFSIIYIKLVSRGRQS
jgi:multiple sugar transport system permease protein